MCVVRDKKIYNQLVLRTFVVFAIHNVWQLLRSQSRELHPFLMSFCYFLQAEIFQETTTSEPLIILWGLE